MKRVILGLALILAGCVPTTGPAPNVQAVGFNMTTEFNGTMKFNYSEPGGTTHAGDICRVTFDVHVDSDSIFFSGVDFSVSGLPEDECSVGLQGAGNAFTVSVSCNQPITAPVAFPGLYVSALAQGVFPVVVNNVLLEQCLTEDQNAGVGNNTIITVTEATE